ncbi:MAG: sigma-54-dependent Fis family transcriptional regulator [Ignavibacteriae bacterium]|nr:sigma-54-dependent Fis family transcriptional regulator [Ignavibacteriota bacterium]
MPLTTHTFLARSATMLGVFERLSTIAPSSSAVLLVGETGVGKEVVAEYIHRHSNRNNRPFVKVGLATLPPELLESEIFGHEKGAYTNAIADKKGLFELANHGTMFLDDIDDFPLHLQPKLLRVLETGEVMRVGSVRSVSIDIRLICATKVDLQNLVHRGFFRSDLFYRINVVPIYIPPLRDRRDDVPLLIEHFLQRYASDREIHVHPDALARLCAYSWPGNVRELRNVAQRLSLFAGDTVQIADLPDEIRQDKHVPHGFEECVRCAMDEHRGLDDILSCIEFTLLKRALRTSHGNRSQAARRLGLRLSTFRDRLHRHGLDTE